MAFSVAHANQQAELLKDIQAFQKALRDFNPFQAMNDQYWQNYGKSLKPTIDALLKKIEKRKKHKIYDIEIYMYNRVFVQYFEAKEGEYLKNLLDVKKRLKKLVGKGRTTLADRVEILRVKRDIKDNYINLTKWQLNKEFFVTLFSEIVVFPDKMAVKVFLSMMLQKPYIKYLDLITNWQFYNKGLHSLVKTNRCADCDAKNKAILKKLDAKLRHCWKKQKEAKKYIKKMFK